MSAVIGSDAAPASIARVAERDLKEDDEQEEDRAECGVDDERDEVRARELARGEDREREHRLRAAALLRTKATATSDADSQRGQDDRRADALLGGLDQGEGDAAQAERGERGPRRSSRPVIVGSRVSGTWRREAQTTNAPSGRLIRKIARQLTASIR